MKQIVVRGNAYQRGRQYAMLLKARVRKHMPNFLKPGTVSAKEHALFRRTLAYYRTVAPGLIDELKGMADGFGQRFEILFRRNISMFAAPGRCTALAFAGAGGELLVGATNDGCSGDPLPPGCSGPRGFAAWVDANNVALTVVPDRGYRYMGVNRLGLLWTSPGINEKGLVVATTSGHPGFTVRKRKGIFGQLFPSLILQTCATVPEAVAFLGRYPLFGKGVNFLLADRTGQMAVVEKSAAWQAVRAPKNKVLFTTNHWVSPKMQKLYPRLAPEFINYWYFQNSLNRFVNLNRIFEKDLPARTLHTLVKLLRNHHQPGAICQHPDNNDARWFTMFGVILRPRNAEMRVVAGSPCRGRFTAYRLKTRRTQEDITRESVS